MRVWMTMIAAIASLGVPGAASACRFHRPPAEHLENRLNAPREAVVAVRVVALETIGEGEFAEWRASLKTRAVLEGTPTRDLFVAQEFGGGGLCWRVPRPAVGERWIVFLAHADDEGGFAYPEALLPEGTLEPSRPQPVAGP